VQNSIFVLKKRAQESCQGEIDFCVEKKRVVKGKLIFAWRKRVFVKGKLEISLLARVRSVDRDEILMRY
jgi:hypothetical protein